MSLGSGMGVCPHSWAQGTAGAYEAQALVGEGVVPFWADFQQHGPGVMARRELGPQHRDAQS